MVSLQERFFKINDISYPIVSFAVWFKTPRGITPNLDEAIGICQSINADPELNIWPQAVALTDTEGVYEAV